MAHDVISRRPNNSVVVSGITDIAGPADGLVLVENGRAAKLAAIPAGGSPANRGVQSLL
jgi:hypothetical protein